MKSFTLLEIMVVMIILGILATIAIPQFIVPRERALDNEAMTNLKLIQAAMRILRMETGTYIDCANATCLNTNLRLDLSVRNWRYASDEINPGLPTDNVYIKARRNNPPAGWGRDFFIDEDDAEACCCDRDSTCLSAHWCAAGYCPASPNP